MNTTNSHPVCCKNYFSNQFLSFSIILPYLCWETTLTLPLYASHASKTFFWSPISFLFQSPLSLLFCISAGQPPSVNSFILIFAEHLHRYLMLEAEIKGVTALTSKKLLKLRGLTRIWLNCTHSKTNNATFKPNPATILNSLKLKIAQLLSQLPADGQTIFNSGF